MTENQAAREKYLKEESLKISEDNKYLKEIALKEKEEKIRIKTHLDEEISFFKSQIEYIKEILTKTETEKLKTESDYLLLVKDSEELMSNYQKVSSEKNILQHYYEELNKKFSLFDKSSENPPSEVSFSIKTEKFR